MRTKSFLSAILCAMASAAMAQSFTVYENGKSHGFNDEDVDSIVFSANRAQASTQEPRQVKGRWFGLFIYELPFHSSAIFRFLRV